MQIDIYIYMTCIILMFLLIFLFLSWIFFVINKLRDRTPVGSSVEWIILHEDIFILLLIYLFHLYFHKI